MSMQDEEEWKNVFRAQSSLTEEESEGFSDVQEVYITDLGSTPQAIVFDNISQMNTPCIISESYLEIPVLWSNSNNQFPYTPGASAIAPKEGWLSLLQGVVFQSASGEQIVNEPIAPWFINQIRPKLELTQQGTSTVGPEGCLQPDRFPRYIAPVYNQTAGINNRPAFGMQYAGINTFGGYGGTAGATAKTFYPPYYDNIAATQTANNVYSDILCQNNEFNLGFGISAVTVGTAGSGVTVGSVATFTGTFNIQVNPLTFTAVASDATHGAWKYLAAAPVMTAAGLNPNGVPVAPHLDSDTKAATLITETGLNIAANTSNMIYDANWPVISITCAGASGVTKIVLVKPGSGLMYCNTGTDATQDTGVCSATLGSTGNVYTTDGRLITAINSFQLQFKIGPCIPSAVCANNPVTPQYGFGMQVPIINQPLVSPNPVYNKGFDQRVRSFWNNTVCIQRGVAGTSYDVYQTNMIIRLKDLHDHFAKLEFPIVNFRFSLQIFLASPLFTSSPYYGMMLGAGAPQMSPPVMAVNGSGAAPASGVPQWGGQGQCRLYMKTVRFDGPQALQYRLMLEKSMHPKFVHLECEIYLMGQNLNQLSLAGTPVTTATTNAQRIWIFGLPNGVQLPNITNNPNANATGLAAGSTLSVSLPQFGLLPTCRFNQLTLLINQKPWRDLQYNYDWEYWQHFREETRGNGNSWADGSMINYDQFLTGSALFYPFSLARAGKRLNKNEQIQISVQGTRIADQNSLSGATNNQTPIDLYMIIEKTARVDYYITEGSSKVVKTY